MENNEKLAHASDERGLGVLPIGAQPQIESCDGGDCCEHLPPSPYTGRAERGRGHPRYNGCRACFRYRVKWCQTGQCGDLLAVEHTQFRQLREQRTREHLCRLRGPNAATRRARATRGVLRINSPSSSSIPESRFSNHWMCSSILRSYNLWNPARRFFYFERHYTHSQVGA